MRIWTVGHSTRSADALAALLGEHGIEAVVDVRSVPRSRANPQFNADAFPAVLADAGIGYRHLKALGGLRGRQDLGRPSPNGLWRVDGFRNYADYALTRAFGEALADLRAGARLERSAIMCAEAVWWRCHRRIIADYLLAGGCEVVHILGPGHSEDARLTAGAEVQPDGTVHYPPAQSELL